MHILVIASWYPTHAADTTGSFFREQALTLKKSDQKVGVITPAFRSLTQWRTVALGGFGIKSEVDNGLMTLRYHGIRIFSWSHSLNKEFWERTGLRIFNEYVRHHGLPNILHVQGMIYGLSWAAAIHRKFKIPFIITEHSSEFSRNNTKPKLLSYISEQSRYASRTFAVSKALGQLLESKVPLLTHRCWETMPNMVSSRFSKDHNSDQLTVSNFNPMKLLSVATLDMNKGLHHVLIALRMAIDAGENYQLRVCGSGPREFALKSLMKKLKLDDKVTFLGHCTREQVSSEMKSSDALIISSSYETFGVVALEALMSGKPVLSTRCGGPEDIIVDGQDGILVDKNDPNALYAGLLRLKNEIALFDSNEISRRCANRFSEQAFANRYLNVYREVIRSTSQTMTP